jgi:hypothetical protein
MLLVSKPRPLPAVLGALAALLLLGLLAPPLGAEGPDPEEPPATTALHDATDEEAKPIVEGLKTAARKRKREDAMPLLDAVGALRHPEFERPLVQLLQHPDAAVARRAAELLEPRVGALDAKAATALWKAGWMHPLNDKRHAIQAKTLRILARGGVTLDRKQHDDVAKLWRRHLGNPEASVVGVLLDIAWYYEHTKDKRLCRLLAEELDEPQPADVNSPTNPPASWWEARWKAWKELKPAVVSALRSITGQEFDKTDEAKRWFKMNERTFGFSW